jgi:hypothetical protein
VNRTRLCRKDSPFIVLSLGFLQHTVISLIFVAKGVAHVIRAGACAVDDRSVRVQVLLVLDLLNEADEPRILDQQVVDLARAFGWHVEASQDVLGDVLRRQRGAVVLRIELVRHGRPHGGLAQGAPVIIHLHRCDDPLPKRL